LAGNGWQIVETEDYERAVGVLGGAREVDTILAPILYAVSRRPTGFPLVREPDIYLARTSLQINGPDLVLAHSLWFRVVEHDRIVELKWVEQTAPDDI